jgi:hypothetical protein
MVAQSQASSCRCRHDRFDLPGGLASRDRVGDDAIMPAPLWGERVATHDRSESGPAVMSGPTRQLDAACGRASALRTARRSGVADAAQPNPWQSQSTSGRRPTVLPVRADSGHSWFVTPLRRYRPRAGRVRRPDHCPRHGKQQRRDAIARVLVAHTARPPPSRVSGLTNNGGSELGGRHGDARVLRFGRL